MAVVDTYDTKTDTTEADKVNHPREVDITLAEANLEVEVILDEIDGLTYETHLDLVEIENSVNNLVDLFTYKYVNFYSSLDDDYSDLTCRVVDVLSTLITNLNVVDSHHAERIMRKCSRPINLINNLRVILDNDDNNVLLQTMGRGFGTSYLLVTVQEIYQEKKGLRVNLIVNNSVSSVGSFPLDQIVLNKVEDIAGREEIRSALRQIDIECTRFLELKVIGGNVYSGKPKVMFPESGGSIGLEISHINGEQLQSPQYLTIDASQITDIDGIEVIDRSELIATDQQNQESIRNQHGLRMFEKYPDDETLPVSIVPNMTSILNLIPNLQIVRSSSKNYYIEDDNRRVRSSVSVIYKEGSVSYPIRVDYYDTGNLDVKIEDMKGGANKSRIINKLSGKIRDTLRGLREFEN
jgi:hypothetical protein